MGIHISDEPIIVLPDEVYTLLSRAKESEKEDYRTYSELVRELEHLAMDDRQSHIARRELIEILGV